MPHCGAYTTQYWYRTSLERIRDKPPVPSIGDTAARELIEQDKTLLPEKRTELLEFLDKLLGGRPFIREERNGRTVYLEAHNLSVSECYACDQFAVWIHDRLLYPPNRRGAAPNEDLPPDILADYEEARSILDLSPRGSAALLRLCVQKLCAFLGEKGKYIDEDIANLVAKGLNPLVQKSLDIVRVIGNEAVHPGTMDLQDNRDTASALFGLINAIADQMITHPKFVDKMYGTLPSEKREAIEARDAKKRE